jgi:hypothetical protein
MHRTRSGGLIQAVTIKSSNDGRKDGTRARSLQMHTESRKHAGRKKSRLTYFGDEVAQLSFTRLQGQYLAFIAAYTKVNGLAPAEADMQRYFRVTAPSVHQMS